MTETRATRAYDAMANCLVAAWAIIRVLSVIVAIMAAAIFLGWRPVCGSENIADGVSPNGRERFIIYEYSCPIIGARTTSVAIREAALGTAPGRAHNLFRATAGPQHADLFAHGTIAVAVKWVDDSHLHILYDERVSSWHERSRWNGFDITYEAAPLSDIEKVVKLEPWFGIDIGNYWAWR